MGACAYPMLELLRCSSRYKKWNRQQRQREAKNELMSSDDAMPKQGEAGSLRASNCFVVFADGVANAKNQRPTTNTSRPRGRNGGAAGCE